MTATSAPGERWQRVTAVIDALFEQEPADRRLFLTEACAGDATLRADVERLLTAAETPSFLDSGALAFAEPLLDVVADESEPSYPVGLSYELMRKLGQGGTATVYLARDIKHDRFVAVKVLHADLTARVEADRFVREIRLTARLQHPHVLGLLDSGVFPAEAGAFAGRPYYVMPYVEGESLRARIAAGHAIEPTEAARLLREVADALAYAHEQGLVHRDIKPENILISRGHAVVADFGIAKALSVSHAEVGSPIGTPAYMAPEQAAPGSVVDHRADLYAWGVVGYELLAARHPFASATSARELVAAHAREAPRSLSEIAPALPSSLADLVMRCLAKAPDERPNSARDLLAALDGATTSAPVPTLGRVRSPRRAPAIVAVALLIGAAAAIARTLSGGTATRRVVGTGDPKIDVPAVQAAVDHADSVLLEGHFSFETPPTKAISPRLASGWFPPAAEIVVSRAAHIIGVRAANNALPTIDGGTVPFYVDAPRGAVVIRGIRFVRPRASAIIVHAVRGLEISNSNVDGIVPYRGRRRGIPIAIYTSGETPMPSSPGDPDNVSGKLLITGDTIDARAASPHEGGTGIMIGAIGKRPGREVELDIINNLIENTTESTINIRAVEGRVRVLANTLRTASEEPDSDPAVVRLVNHGPFLMANNTVECRWPNSMCIAVFSQYEEWPLDSAVVDDNDVLMSPPAGASLGESNAALTVKGFARRVVVRNNTIRGRGRAGLAISPYRGGVPEDVAFIDNRFDGFTPLVADIFVASGITKKRIVGPGSVIDHGDRP